MMQLVRDGRDLRVDFFRGIALFCIFLDHIPHDTLARFTVRNLALNDATEIFSLLDAASGTAAIAGATRPPPQVAAPPLPLASFFVRLERRFSVPA